VPVQGSPGTSQGVLFLCPLLAAGGKGRGEERVRKPAFSLSALINRRKGGPTIDAHFIFFLALGKKFGEKGVLGASRNHETGGGRKIGERKKNSTKLSCTVSRPIGMT